MADQDLDETMVVSHLGRAHSSVHRSRRLGRVAVVAACAAALAAPAAALTIAAVDEDEPVPASTSARPAPVQAEDELSCTGPPPFAGEVPEGDTPEEQEANREAEAEAFEAWREANCTDEDPAGDPAQGRPDVGGECSGPPPFAETEAEGADPHNGVVPSPRAAEARAFAETRAACGGGDGEGTDVEAPTGAARTGPPEGTPSGPPEGTPTGPPQGTPTGPPEGTPAPQGAGDAERVDGAQSGPPQGTPSGPPPGTPSGPPEGTPSGPPEGTPADDATGLENGG